MAIRSTDGGGHLLRYPEVGGVKAVLGLPLVYHLVAIATPHLVVELERALPGLAPEPFTTFMALVLWAAVALTALTVATTRKPVRTYEFDSEETLRAHLERYRPGRRQVGLYALLAVGGAAIALLTYGGFRGSFLEISELFVVVVGESFPDLGVVDALWLVGFVGGYALFASGVDRLVVAGARAFLYERYVEERAVSDDDAGVRDIITRR